MTPWCSARVPCEKLIRATSMPAAIIRASISALSVAGPIVATILVRRPWSGRAASDRGIATGSQAPGRAAAGLPQCAVWSDPKGCGRLASRRGAGLDRLERCGWPGARVADAEHEPGGAQAQRARHDEGHGVASQ